MHEGAIGLATDIRIKCSAQGKLKNSNRSGSSECFMMQYNFIGCREGSVGFQLQSSDSVSASSKGVSGVREEDIFCRNWKEKSRLVFDFVERAQSITIRERQQTETRMKTEETESRQIKTSCIANTLPCLNQTKKQFRQKSSSEKTNG